MSNIRMSPRVWATPDQRESLPLNGVSCRCEATKRTKLSAARPFIPFLLLVSPLSPMFFPDHAWAFQSHPAPEGLYVHQLAHVVFIISMAFLVYWLEVNLFTRERGWRYIQVSALFFILWNLVAVSGHCVEEMVPRELFVGDPDWSQRLIAGTTLWVDLFYVLKLDHIVCVPAIVCLFLGVRTLYLGALRQGNSTDA